MRIVCARCQQEGLSGLLREEPPLSAKPEADSHGICELHAVTLLEWLRRLLEPGTLPRAIPRDIFSIGLGDEGRSAWL